MANVIKPKHGETDPPQNALQYGEIGININDLTMFVGTDKGSKKINAEKAESAKTAESATSAKTAEKALIANTISEKLPISKGGTGNTSRNSALNALFAGGSGETDANIVGSGVYVLTSSDAINLPPESAYYILMVFRYHTDDLACGQLAINLSNGNLYSRDYVSGNWKEWVSCSSKKIETTEIPNNANLNDETYRIKGFYSSRLGTNSITNLPDDYDGDGAFELVVTGIGGSSDNTYCTQWLKSYISNKIWVRTQKNWQTPWYWTDWKRIPLMSEVITQGTDGIELGTNATVAHGGYIDFHFNGSTEDYTSRLIESSQGTIRDIGNLDVTGWLQCSNGLWIAGGGFYASNNNTNVYGTDFPSGHTKGRIFFKKA